MVANKQGWLGAACVLAVGLAVGLSGCGGDTGGGPSGSPTGAPTDAGAPAGGGAGLTGAGATFPNPLYSKWFAEYRSARGATINYQPIGSGGGIQQLKEGTVDFGASDAPLTDEEEAEMPAPVVTIPTVAGSVVLVYNLPEVTQPLKLTPEAVAGIFLGTIKNWNDPAIAAANAEVTLPSTPIAVARRSDGSGTTYIFTNYLAAVSPEWKAQVGAGKSVEWPVGLGGKGNDGVTGLVKQTPGSIGYVELAYAVQNQLKYAAVKNAAGEFVEPTVESTTAAAEAAADALAKDVRTPIVNAAGAKAYPISGFTYILLYREQKDEQKGKTLVQLLDWAIHDGQKLAADLHYAPLPENVVKLNEERLKSVTYGGQPLLGEGAAANEGAAVNAPAEAPANAPSGASGH